MLLIFLSSEWSGLTEVVFFVYNRSFEINYKMLCVVRNNAHRVCESSRFANSDSEENWKHLWETISFFAPWTCMYRTHFLIRMIIYHRQRISYLWIELPVFISWERWGIFQQKLSSWTDQFLGIFWPVIHATLNLHVRLLPGVIVTRSGMK